MNTTKTGGEVKEKLKQLDTKVVEATSGLIALALLLIAGGAAIAVGFGIPIAILGALSRGEFSEAGIYLVLGVAGFYLYRGITRILNEAKGILD